MSTALKVMIIAGGLTHERDVSLRSGRRVANLLVQEGFEVKVHDLDTSLIEAIDAFEPDVVWPLVHGSIGEDGSLQALLEAMGVPFVGSGSMQSMVASNKPTAKTLLREEGIPTPDWISLPQAFFRQVGATQVVDRLAESLEFPVIIKPADGGSALGLSRADDAAGLRSAMVDAFAYGERVMVERFIEGREVAVSVVDLGEGAVALPPVEIVTDDGEYDYDARYTTDSASYFVPARLEAHLISELSLLAVAAHDTLGLSDLSRIDFVIDENDIVWFIDANVCPGMTDTSLFPQAADASGSFAKVCADIVRFVAAGRPPAIEEEIEETE